MIITEVLVCDKDFGPKVAISIRRVSARRTAQKVDASSAVTRAARVTYLDKSLKGFGIRITENGMVRREYDKKNPSIKLAINELPSSAGKKVV